jgi:anion-transporting  ArsA/GET3 family ATPase
MPGPLLQRRLLVVTGKGGVGKSTVAAALALQLARSGRRTLLCEVNAGDRLAPLLGHAPVGPSLVEVEPNLFLTDLRPDEAMREYVLLKIRLERVYRAVFENRMVRYFLRFIPALAETVMLGKILWHVRQPRGSPDHFDTLVIDAPATGHALTFLGVPRALLTTLPTGPMSSEARWMQELLVDPSVTGVVLVSLPEELPVSETLELGEQLRGRLGLSLGAVVLNQAVPGRFSARDRAALDGRPGLAALVDGYQEDAEHTAEAERRLARLELPLLHLPRLTVPALGPKDVAALGATLVRELEAA